MKTNRKWLSVSALVALLSLIWGENALAAQKRTDAEYEALYRKAIERLAPETQEAWSSVKSETSPVHTEKASNTEREAVEEDKEVLKAKEALRKAQEAEAKAKRDAELAAEAAKKAEKDAMERARKAEEAKKKAEEERRVREAKAKKLADEAARKESVSKSVNGAPVNVTEIPEGKEIVSKPKVPEKVLLELPPLNDGGAIQAGGDMVDVVFSGKGLPEPFVYLKQSTLIFLFPNTRLGFGVGDFRTANTSVFNGSRSYQNGKDSIIEIRVNQPIKLQNKHAFTPADEMTYRFVTQRFMERVQREASMPPAKRPKPLKADSGPFSKNIYVNLELRDTEIKDLFRMLGGYMKKNIIVDASVPQAVVTMTMKQVALSEVFEYLMKTHDIWYHMLGDNTVVVGTREGLAKISDQLDTRTYRAGYGEPKDLAPMLSSILKIPAENIIVDERLKSLVVTAGAAKHERIVEILQKMDRPGRQIMLHAKIVEFSKSAGKDIDAAVNMIYDNWHFRSIGGSLTSGLMRGVSRNPLNPGSSFYDAPDEKSGGAFLPNVTDPKNVIDGLFREFDAAVKVMEQKGQGEMVASPSVVAIDGLEAAISLTEDYPYVADRDDAGNPSWASKTVGPQLKLTPHVGRDGVITVKVDIQTGEVIEMMQGSNGEQMPRTSNRSVQTTVRVRNGEPFVVGGLFRDTKTSKIQKVPLLGDLPVLGTLFRSKGHSRVKTEAVIVVVPYVIETPDVPIESEFVTSWQ